MSFLQCLHYMTLVYLPCSAINVLGNGFLGLLHFIPELI